MHRAGTKHIIRHMQKSVLQWSVISKFTCISNTVTYFRRVAPAEPAKNNRKTVYLNNNETIMPNHQMSAKYKDEGTILKFNIRNIHVE